MSELYHYGVLGMKWGVRKEYKPVGQRNSISQRLTGTITIHDKKYYENARKKNEEDSAKGKLPEKYMPESEAIQKLNKLKRANMHLTDEQQSLATNHNGSTPERKVNCFECTLAYEMRQRGYVVQANETPGGAGFQVIHAFDVKDSCYIEESSASAAYKAMEKQCLSYGEGARGMLGIVYADVSGGHAMNWVVENGEFKIFDAQTNKVPAMDSFAHSDGRVEVYRLDNARVLPGVMDFVEEFEASEEEKEKAKERAEELKKRREQAEKDRSKEIKIAQKADKQRLKEWEKKNKPKEKFNIKKGLASAGKAIKDFGTKTIDGAGKLIAKGKTAVENLIYGETIIIRNEEDKKKYYGD